MANPRTECNRHSAVGNDEFLEPIAIVGAACRLAGEASSLHGLWDMMQNSRTAHVKVPEDRWDADAWYHPDPDRKGSLNTTHGFFLEQDVAAFDAPFFSVTAKEAAGMDPAKRLLLEVSYEAFENAGLPMDKVAGSKTGVYVGSMTSDYELLSTREIYDEPHMAAAGSSEAMTANRVSWFFDLRGPSLTLDTACSSSLYALHLACQSLRLRETNMALVAGVSVILHPNFMQQLVAMHMLSPDGISHTFDDRANGYGRGEGFGGLVIKRLSDAIRDGDTIRAVIRGSGTNVDGKTPSVTMPSPEAQADLIRDVYREAGLPLDQTQYIELHGTGTPVGDPIELSAIAATFGACRSDGNPVYVGSIKPNVGHTEGCAGLAGVFKAMMCLEKGILLPTAEVEKINPKLRFADWNLALPAQTLAWPTHGPRRVSVNSFGFGGANAHIILDDAYHYMKAKGLNGKRSTLHKAKYLESNPISKSEITNGPTEFFLNGDENGINMTKKPKKKLFVLSSRDEPGIQRLGKSLGAYWKSDNVINDVTNTGTYLSDVAYTLATRRSLFDYRSSVVAESKEELVQGLEGPLPRLKRSTKQNRVAFVFTGQGAQWAGMGRQLIEFPTFAASIARSKACLESLSCPFDVEIELQRTEGSKIESSEYSQPMCTVVQIALVELLAEWNIRPKAVVGHSSGEIAAAYAAGILSHEDAVKVAFIRGVYSGMVSQGPKAGAMLAAGISEEEAEAYLAAIPSETVVTACVNSPKSVTLSGDAEFVDVLEQNISKDGKFARKLRVVTAYHSPHMRMVADDCLRAMVEAGVGGANQEAKIPMFSSVTGQLIDPIEVGKSYWIRNMCGTVRFSQAVSSLLVGSSGRRAGRKATIKWDALLEVGPHAALKAPLVQIMENIDTKLPSELLYTSLLVRKEDAVTTVLKAAGSLWATGIPILLGKVNREEDLVEPPQVVVDLPSYAWNHERVYWHETPATKEQRLRQKPRTDLLGIAVENQNSLEPQWRNYLRVRENPWVEDHKITGTTLYPGAGMLIMVIEAIPEIAISEKTLKGVNFKNVHFERGLVIPTEGATETVLQIQIPDNKASFVHHHTFSVYSRISDSPWVKNCFGLFDILYEEADAPQNEDLSSFEWKMHVERYNEMKQLPSKAFDVKKLYKSLHDVGMQYGPTFQNLTTLDTVPDTGFCHGTVEIPDTRSVMPHEYEFSHLIHPATLDAIFHLIVVAVANGTTLTEAAVPSMLEKLFISFKLPQGPGELFSGFSQRVKRRDKQLSADLIVSDASWSEPKIIVKGLIMTQVSSGASSASHLLTDGNEKKTTNIVWKADPDALLRRGAQVSSSTSVEISRLRHWLELECHKSAGLRVLFMASTLHNDVFAEISPFIMGETPYRGFAQLTIACSSDDALQQWKTQTEKAKNTVNFTVWNGIIDMAESKFDLIIIGHPGEREETSRSVLAHWQHAMTSSGRMIIVHGQKGEMNGTNGHNTPPDANIAELQVESSYGADFSVLMDQSIEATPATEVCLLLPSSSDIPLLARTLEDVLRQENRTTRKVYLEDAASLKDLPVISLLDDSFTTTWNKTEFEHFQTLIASAKHVFWITTGTQMLTSSKAGLNGAPLLGLLRVLRNEFPQITLAHIDLSPAFDVSSAREVELIVDSWKTSVDDTMTEKDLELAEVNGDIVLPRVVEDTSMDAEIALSIGVARPTVKEISTCGPLRLVTGSIGVRELAWENDDEADKPLGPEEVEVSVVDISISPFGSNGGENLGSQLTGRVVRYGSEVTGFLKDDRVAVFGLKACRTHVRQHQSLLLKLDEHFPLEGSAASIWTLILAYYVLKHITYLASGDSILIQNGATELGQALLYLASQTDKTKIFATVKTAEQKSQLLQTCGLPEESIIIVNQHGKNDSLAAYLVHKTQGAGIDIMVSSGATIDDDLAACLSDFGRFAVVLGPGKTAQAVPSLLPGNVSFSTIDPIRLILEQPRLVSKLLQNVRQLINNGIELPEITPKVAFSVSDFGDALNWVQKPEHNGFASIRLHESEGKAYVPVMALPPPTLKLDANATYVLAGGLGSLGLRIAGVMAQNGAAHLVFLSRSGSDRYVEKLRELHKQGCETLVVKCDVTSPEDVRSVVTEISKTGRPIKGLVQCAMVLQDSLFDKMTYEQWSTAFKPKVNGSWNLHVSLPENMDFFIMLSSVVSVTGNVSQANYAAGNSYMDALAHYRRSRGMAATAINAGLVADSDHTIDGTSMEDYLDRFKHMASVSTTLQELDIAIAASIRGVAACGEALSPQFVFCMSDTLQPDGVDFWARDRKFIHRISKGSDNALAGAESSGPSVAVLLGAATSRQDALVIIQDTLKKLLAPGLGIQPGDIDADRPLYELGVDSFKAVEIRNQLFRELKSDVSVFEILSPNSLAYLADQLVSRSLLVPPQVREFRNLETGMSE